MACLAKSSPLVFNTSSSASTSSRHLALQKRRVSSQVKADLADFISSIPQEKINRRQILTSGLIAANIVLLNPNSASAEAAPKKGFQAVNDRKDNYSFLYPFGWQEVSVQGQDKVFKDVIEPLESVSVNLIPTTKENIKELGPPQSVAETLVKKVLAPSSQKTKLIEASEHDVDGKVYYTFEFTAQAPNFTRHALGAITIANGKFYTLTTGANERRWGKMKDKLHEVVDSFKIESR